ncbi:MAG: efflux RND transporter periplasmic adaptor subunit [Planctomycetota bacterium]
MATGAAIAQPGGGPSRVVVANVIKTTRAGNQSFVGTLEATRKTTIGSAVEGRVVEVNFNAGDPLTGSVDPETGSFIGQPMVQLLTTTLDIEIRAAEIQATLTQQALDELELTLPRNLELARATLAGAQSRLDYSRTRFERSQSLQTQSGAISQLELDEARSLFEADQQAVIGAQADVDRLMSTSDLQIQQARSRHDAAEQELLRLRDLRNKYTISAPFEGVVIQKMTEVGAWVTQGQAVAEIVQLNPIEMIVNVPQEYSGQLQQSLQAASESEKALRAEILINGLGDRVTGEVVRIVPQADLRSRSFPVRIRIGNPQNGDIFLLQPGMLGRAYMEIGRPQEMTLVLKDALVLSQGETTVYKIGREGEKTIAIPVTVTTGSEVGDWIQVSGNLNENDRVVVLGNERLRPRSEVDITESRVEQLEESEMTVVPAN